MAPADGGRSPNEGGCVMAARSQMTSPRSMGDYLEIELSSWEGAKERIKLLGRLLPDQYERQKGTRLRDQIYRVPVLLAEGMVMNVSFTGQSIFVDVKPARQIPEMKPWTRQA